MAKYVIDIDKELISQEVFSNVDLIQTIAPAIHNATPLEKVLEDIKVEMKKLSPTPTAFDVVDGNQIKEAIWSRRCIK